MSSFSFSEYNAVVTAAQAGENGGITKVGYFKLSDDGDEALVRFNISSIDELSFASVHTISLGGKQWLKVSCINPLGSNAGGCELCAAAAANNTSITKALKKVYLPAMVSYKDRVTGSWSEAQPVIWERSASFSRDIYGKLKDYGDLRNVLFKVTRIGAKGDIHTRYDISFAVPTVFKPEMVPANFTAFNNFDITKHSYWEKTVDEIKTYLATGKFPDTRTATSAVGMNNQPAPTPNASVNTFQYGAQPNAQPQPQAQPTFNQGNYFTTADFNPSNAQFQGTQVENSGANSNATFSQFSF